MIKLEKNLNMFKEILFSKNNKNSEIVNSY